MSKRKAEELRRIFDSGFAAAPTAIGETAEQLLVLRVGEERFAARIGELAAVLPLPRVTPLPSEAPALLGLVAVRGALVATFRADALLGLAPAAPQPRWLLTCAADPTIGLAFHALEGRLAVAPDEIGSRGSDAHRYVPQVVRAEGSSPLGVVDLGEIAAAAAGRGRPQPARRHD